MDELIRKNNQIVNPSLSLENIFIFLVFIDFLFSFITIIFDHAAADDIKPFGDDDSNKLFEFVFRI